MFGFAVKSIEFSSGQVVDLPCHGVVLIVGANNVGKSRCLREVAARLGAIGAGGYVVTKSVTDNRKGSSGDFYDWLEARFQIDATSPGRESISGLNLAMETGPSVRQAAESVWKNDGPIQWFAPVLISYLDTERRLGGANPIASFAASVGPSELLHVVYRNRAGELRFRNAFRRVFQTDVLLDRVGGNRIAFHVGDEPKIDSADDDPTSAFLEHSAAIAKLPELSEQGDGMRSYAACLLHTEVLDRPVVMIDEPETFLHPPQARGLGRHLAATAATGNRQIILATHSADVVRGTLDEGSANVCVVRLSREDGKNVARPLDSAQVRTLWDDPLLRAAGVLEGLFHQRVVLCEGDADCRFYRAVLEAIESASDVARTDVLFTHTGGKDRLAVAASALRAVDVPVSVVADIDVLSDANKLRVLWESLGNDWDMIKKDQRILHAAIRSTARPRKRDDLAKEISAVLAASSDDPPTNGEMKKLRELLKPVGGWSDVKRAGMGEIPKGDARKTADSLLIRLRLGNLHVVPVGELEGFAPQFGGHGPSWVANALSMNLAKDGEASTAREFVKSLFGISATE